jgi:hypothetical protein
MKFSSIDFSSHNFCCLKEFCVAIPTKFIGTSLI